MHGCDLTAVGLKNRQKQEKAKLFPPLVCSSRIYSSGLVTRFSARESVDGGLAWKRGYE